ncbi:uncharacterized protein [Halyomorpha halys]|uniref:uncharacterized protein n=1 Tax=Halyomorpha halys TaxID=286706 RepID=UPI0006D4F459|nr:uncharacterized protein LOC106684118 isoform X2 [Halyomorpha halys]XP_014281497.1 uncharacterized protein LOC106684118 isoform X2 [Halyomorpha halys]XP_014281498.1 uncharacterized protein LOC106684118 isoform X2 [Halyomorpha halys]
MDKKVLEVALKKCASESSIKHIIDIKLESALPKGENYTSTIFRAKLKVVLGSGRVTTKSYILKKETVEEGTDKTFKDYNFTNAEISVYLKVLQQMDYLMEEFGDTEGPLWCKLIHFSQADSTFILEDLKASGFSTVKRTELQDIEHARLALRSLGRFHAMAKVLEGRGHISKDDYKPWPFLYDEEFYRAIVFGGVKALVKGMRDTWGEDWAETADLLGQITFEEFVRRMKNCANFGKDIFRCLNHGDCWNNNMMFKHNWEGKPIEIRFIDFQLPHYDSPCLDLIYYIYTSIKPDLRRQNYKSLIKFYHDSLTSSLDRFGFQGSKPSLNEIEENMERLSFCILAIFASGHAIDSSKTDNAMDITKIFETKGEEGFNLSIFSEPGIKEKIADDLKTLVKKIQEKV